MALPNYEEIRSDALAKNAGSHNSIYRGKDITNLFYNGTLTTEIAAGTFDDIFVGDYIIGQTSGRKYLVADINYRLHTGDIECTTNHVLMIPEKIMGTSKMNDSGTTNGAYVGSKMHTTYLAPYRTIVENDFGSAHILETQNILTTAVSNGASSSWSWDVFTIELMSECMVYGHNVWAGSSHFESGIDKKQLALFSYRQDLIVGINDNNERTAWWLRDVVSNADFALVYPGGVTRNSVANGVFGVRPAFLIY